MSKPYYPTVDIGALVALSTISQQLQLHKDYLTSRDCPYDKDTREQIKKLLAPKVVEKVVEKIVEKEAIRQERVELAAEGAGAVGRPLKMKGQNIDLDMVSTELQDIRRELTQLKLDSKALQTADKIQIIKTRAGLLEKLASMAERNNNLKRMALFQSTVLNILDDLVPQDRRTEFIKRITPFASEE